VCQLFSEPGSGSDLASLRTHAQADGDGWRIDGSKVFFDGAWIADSYRIGETGTGWQVAKTMLGFERAQSGSRPGVGGSWNQPAELAAACPQPLDPTVRERLVQAYVHETLRNITRQRANQSAASARTGPEGSLGKLLWAQGLNIMAETAVALLARSSQPIPVNPAPSPGINTCSGHRGSGSLAEVTRSSAISSLTECSVSHASREGGSGGWLRAAALRARLDECWDDKSLQELPVVCVLPLRLDVQHGDDHKADLAQPEMDLAAVQPSPQLPRGFRRVKEGVPELTGDIGEDLGNGRSVGNGHRLVDWVEIARKLITSTVCSQVKNASGKPIFEGRLTLDELPRLLRQTLSVIDGHRHQEIPAVTKVAVDTWTGDPGLAGHVLHRRLPNSIMLDAAFSRPEYRLPGYLASAYTVIAPRR
jgi:hypothetical protein